MIVDTSGSMSPYIHRAATAVAQGMRRVHRPRVICFDTEPGWLEILGGGWRWGISHHPPRGPLWIEPVDAPGFELVDEAYHNMSPGTDVDIRASCTLDEGSQPVVWTRRFGQGRVAVDTLGHDRQSLENAAHARLIGAQLDWLAAA